MMASPVRYIACVLLIVLLALVTGDVEGNRLPTLPPNPIVDCARCAGDINQAVQDCEDIPDGDDHALYKCIEDALIAAADCIECICEVLGTLLGIDIEPCRGGK